MAHSIATTIYRRLQDIPMLSEAGLTNRYEVYQKLVHLFLKDPDLYSIMIYDMHKDKRFNPGSLLRMNILVEAAIEYGVDRELVWFIKMILSNPDREDYIVSLAGEYPPRADNTLKVSDFVQKRLVIFSELEISPDDPEDYPGLVHLMELTRSYSRTAERFAEQRTKNLLDEWKTVKIEVDHYTEGKVVDGRWLITKSLSEQSSNGYFNGGIKLVTDLVNKQQCIMKILPSNEEWSHMAEDELNVMRMVSGPPNIPHASHPNVVRLEGSLHVKAPQHDLSMVFTEYCEEGTLSELLHRSLDKKEALSPGFIWHVFEDLTAAGCYLHNGPEGAENWKWIHHHDIILSNVFLGRPVESRSPYPTIKLGDFGIATTEAIIARHKASKAMVRCAPMDCDYVPPEFISDRYDKLDDKADIYQIGVVMWCLLCGETSNFTGKLKHWRMQQRNGMAGLSEHERDLADLIYACTAGLPEARPSAKELLRLVRRLRG